MPPKRFEEHDVEVGVVLVTYDPNDELEAPPNDREWYECRVEELRSNQKVLVSVVGDPERTEERELAHLYTTWPDGNLPEAILAQPRLYSQSATCCEVVYVGPGDVITEDALLVAFNQLGGDAPQDYSSAAAARVEDLGVI